MSPTVKCDAGPPRADIGLAPPQPAKEATSSEAKAHEQLTAPEDKETGPRATRSLRAHDRRRATPTRRAISLRNKVQAGAHGEDPRHVAESACVEAMKATQRRSMAFSASGFFGANLRVVLALAALLVLDTVVLSAGHERQRCCGERGRDAVEEEGDRIPRGKEEPSPYRGVGELGRRHLRNIRVASALNLIKPRAKLVPRAGKQVPASLTKFTMRPRAATKQQALPAPRPHAQSHGPLPPAQGRSQSPAVTVDNSGYLQVELQILGNTGATWRGWGTSLAWFANFVGGLPPAQLRLVNDALFDARLGLGLNLVRYILPGGLNAQKSPDLAALPFQTAPGFRQTPNGPYNWSADSHQRAVLVGAVRRGAQAEAVSYSPPWWMTISGDVAGNTDGLPNLDPRRYPEFVRYLADVIEHFEKVWGIPFIGINPMNEPLARWWKKGGGQEGCAIPMEQMPRLMQLMKAALVQRGLTRTELVGIDDWVDRTIFTLNRSPVLVSLIRRVALHAYRTPTFIKYATTAGEPQFKQLKEMSQRMGKEIWITEWGPWGPRPLAPSDVDLALVQGRSIIELLNVANASAWLYWQVVVPNQRYWPPPFAPNVGLLRMDFNYSSPFRMEVTKQYWCQMHFSRWLRPGARILSISAALARMVLVSYDAARQQLVITAVNQRPTTTTLFLSQQNAVHLRTLSLLGQRCLVYRTSQTESYKQVYAGLIASTIYEVGPLRFEPDAITTYVFPSVRAF